MATSSAARILKANRTDHPIFRWEAHASDFPTVDARRAVSRRGAVRRVDRAVARDCKRRGQTTFCWCPNCKGELISTGSLWEDNVPEGVVTFNCKLCGWWSRWHFDSPVPILLDLDSTTTEPTP